MLAMLHHLTYRHHRAQVNWFHAAENGEVHAFTDEVSELGANLPHFYQHVWYRQPNAADEQAGLFNSTGLMALTEMKDRVSDGEMQFYLCGPVAFMQFAAQQLVTLGVERDRIHYECFGPHKVL